jgi:glycosyltransferase involved in cell wall biosynthesis
VVSVLTDQLVRQGHDVVLFASGDSASLANLVAVVPNAVRLAGPVREPHSYQMLELGAVFERADEFDVIHSHVEYFCLPFGRLVETPILHTMHARMDSPELQPIMRAYRDANLVSISDNQRRPVPYANWVATVYNGINVATYTLERRHGNYLAFLGRISPEKGIEQAIGVARRTGIPLKVAAKVDPADQEYYEHEVKPLLDTDLVEFLGEIGEHQKSAFLGGALALLFPIHWPEPFGLVMIEAMACGTPVIAGRFGSVPEVIADERTGFLCDSIEEMVLACDRIGEISRTYCRQYVEQHFSGEIMATHYEQVYKDIITKHRAGMGRTKNVRRRGAA